MCFVTPVLYFTFISFVFVCTGLGAAPVLHAAALSRSSCSPSTAAKRIPGLLGTYTMHIRKS
jgi:hypothetical protein